MAGPRFEAYKFSMHSISFTTSSPRFSVTERSFRPLKFVANDPSLRRRPLLDSNRSFVDLQLRFNIVTAAYGRVVADRVFITSGDLQVARAIDVLPRARDLAMSAMRQRVQP